MSRYPALAVIAFVLIVVGWLGLIIGLGYYVIYEGLIEPRLPDHQFAPVDLIEIWTGLATGLGGFFTLAAGELVKVIVDIEKNTRAAALAFRGAAADGTRAPREPTF